MGEEFDSEKHEAMMHLESVDVPENHIIQVFQKGYALNGKMVQYAKVSVSKGNTKS
jgi:molecular chaperone GrpE